MTKSLQKKYAKQALLIDGPELSHDHSYYLVDECQELKEVEKGIPLSQFMTLRHIGLVPISNPGSFNDT